MDECNEYFSVAPALIVNCVCMIVFLGSVYSVFFSSLYTLLKALVLLSLFVSMVLFFYSPDRRVVGVGYNVSNGWSVYSQSHSESAVVLNHSVVTRYLSVLHIKAGKTTHGLIFLGGFFEPFFYRRLRYLIKVH